MLIEVGPVRVRKSYAPNSGTNAAKAGLEARGRVYREPARSEGESGDERLPWPKFLPNSWLSCCSSVHSLLPSACLPEAVVRRAGAATDASCGVAGAADGESETDASGYEVTVATPTWALL